MYRIDSPGSEAGNFVDENPALNKPGTLLPAEYMNMLQAENMAFLTALGVTPDKTQNDQVFKCVLKMVAGTDLIARFTTTGNIALAGLGLQGGGDWGVALNAGNMILVKNQTVPQDNGWYLAAGGTWPRVDYLDSSAEIAPGKLTKVTEGVTLADSMWMLTTDAPIVLNSSALIFERKDKSPNATIQAAFRNLKASANGTNANVSVTIDELVTGDGAGNYLATRTWNDTINLTTNGAGGLDAGAVAVSTWYYCYGITKDDGSKALIASLSSTGPLLPAGFTKWARIGSIRTDATANKYPLAFKQAGRKVRYVTGVGTNVTKLPTMVSGVQGSVPNTFVSVATANFIPPTANSINFTAADTGSTGALIVAPNSTYSYAGTAGVSGNPAPFQTNISSSGNAAVHGEIVLETTNIYVIFSTSTSVLNCIGWEDNF